MAYVNKRRDSGELVQLSVLIPKEFKEKLQNAAKEDRLSVTKYMVTNLTRVIDGETIPVKTRDDEDFKKIDTKLDTIINLISKL